MGGKGAEVSGKEKIRHALTNREKITERKKTKLETNPNPKPP